MGLLYHVILSELCDWPDLWGAGVTLITMPDMYSSVQVGHHDNYYKGP